MCRWGTLTPLPFPGPEVQLPVAKTGLQHQAVLRICKVPLASDEPRMKIGNWRAENIDHRLRLLGGY